MSEAFDLDRFVSAQAGGVYERALAELRAGEKRSHWMWFVFPQIAGLGRSATAIHYAIASRAEAGAYLAHPVLGPRLRECVEAILALPEDASAESIFGGIDAVKLRSSLTLFEAAGERHERFAPALDRYFDGERDGETLRRLDPRRA